MNIFDDTKETVPIQFRNSFRSYEIAIFAGNQLNLVSNVQANDFS